MNSLGEKRVRRNVQFEMLKNFNFNVNALLEKVLEPIPNQIKEYFN